MKQKLSKKDQEILSETPEEAIRRMLFWKDFKIEYRAFKPNQSPNKPVERIARSAAEHPDPKGRRLHRKHNG